MKLRAALGVYSLRGSPTDVRSTPNSGGEADIT
jgi:hypothetical protein